MRLLVAGSLRATLTEVAQAFTAAAGTAVTLEFGASGLLRADYGLTVLTGARVESARRLVSFILSPEGQAILARHGFTAPSGPGG